ncbi:MAG: ATP-binding protein, partial [Bryobacterales bacterium]|nr:ATP-binding protein [Bryobacterales bacterium]
MPLKSPDELRREEEPPRDRISRLCASMLKISTSLDINTVLHEVIDSARILTGAGCGVITIFDDSGKVQEFVSSGFTTEEHMEMAAWPDGPRLLEHFRNLPEPLRLRDLPAYVRSLDFSASLMKSKTMQLTPIRHRDEHIGTFFLAEKEGSPEFTSEDEEIMVLFASQAAASIVNARTYQYEQRARADLEALIETSPVGVVVIDVKNANSVSLNREARRIAERLRMPDRSLEELLEVITFRRGDGREVDLNHVSLSQELSNAVAVRAEEVVLSIPDGRSVTLLVNSTPNRSECGEVESLIVTLQDLEPLEELERMRAEFLSLVSHELRTPLISIKGSTATVLGASTVLDPSEMLQFFRVIDEQADHMRRLIGDLLDAGRLEAGTLSVSPEPAEVAGLVDHAKNTFLSGGSRHTVIIDLPTDLPRVLADWRRIVQVLNNLLSNAASHSPDTSPIRVAAAQDGVNVAISVSDEGMGVPPEILPHLFRRYAGLAGADQKDSVRGAGLGLSICKGLIEAHGGRIWAESGGPGRGTRVSFTIPGAEEAGDSAVGAYAYLARRSRSLPGGGGQQRSPA